MTSLLVEGGAAVHGAFFDAGLPDEALAYLAPLIVGGGGAPGPVGGLGPGRLAGAHRLQRVEVRRVGVDTLISGVLRETRWPEAAGGSTTTD